MEGHDGTPEGAWYFNGSATTKTSYGVGLGTIRSTGIFAISAWIKNDDLTKDAAIIGNTYNQGSYSEPGFLFSYLAGGQLQFMMSGDLDPYGLLQWEVESDVGVISDNNWHHVVVSADRQYLKFYVDGQPAGESWIGSNPIFDDDSYWFTQIGSATAGYYVYEDFWNGSLDDIMIFDYDLSEQEVALLAGTAEGPEEEEENPLAMGKYYRYGFQGQYAEEDSETGWNSFELRNYDPVIGRWLVPDPYGQYWSPYVAFGNNPINFNDPSGGMSDDPPAAKGIGLEGALLSVGNNFDEMVINSGLMGNVLNNVNIIDNWSFFDEVNYRIDHGGGIAMFSTSGNIMSYDLIPWIRKGKPSHAIYDPLDGLQAFGSAGRIKGGWVTNAKNGIEQFEDLITSYNTSYKNRSNWSEYIRDNANNEHHNVHPEPVDTIKNPFTIIRSDGSQFTNDIPDSIILDNGDTVNYYDYQK